jgi:P2-related tail formation protein
MASAVSRYVNNLPAVFQDDPFLGAFLLAFERILSGRPEPDPTGLPVVPAPGLEQILDRIQTYFDPSQTPPDFLPWLAGWVATSLREDWDTATRRRFLSHVVPLYQRRGTKHALQQLLQIYLDPNNDPPATSVDVIDDDPTFPPRYFQVRFTVSERDSHVLARRAEVATAIIDREKPAHTFYGLHINFPSLQIADPATIVNGVPVNGVFINVTTVLGGNVVTPS